MQFGFVILINSRIMDHYLYCMPRNTKKEMSDIHMDWNIYKMMA